MAVLGVAHPIDGGVAQMNAVARRLYGKPYVQLDDSEASAVWDAIEAEEEGGGDGRASAGAEAEAGAAASAG